MCVEREALLLWYHNKESSKIQNVGLLWIFGVRGSVEGGSAAKTELSRLDVTDTTGEVTRAQRE